MSSPASVRPPVLPKQGEQPDPVPQGGRKQLLDRLQTWKQVFLAELLNLLERRRYDLK